MIHNDSQWSQRTLKIQAQKVKNKQVINKKDAPIYQRIGGLYKAGNKNAFDTQCLKKILNNYVQYIFDTLLSLKLFEINIKIVIFVRKNGHPI